MHVLPPILLPSWLLSLEKMVMKNDSIPFNFILVKYVLKLIDKTENPPSVVFERNDDHGEDVAANLSAFLLLKCLNYVRVVPLGLLMIAQHAMTQCPQIPKVVVVKPLLLLEILLLPQACLSVLLHLVIEYLDRHVQWLHRIPCIA